MNILAILGAFYIGKNASSDFCTFYGRNDVSQHYEAMHFSCVALAAHFFIYKGEAIMPDYKTMYLNLFRSVTDAVEILCEAQKKAEETFLRESLYLNTQKLSEVKKNNL